jgi:glycosyltransferase involved in cell wall biosynthesis
MYRGKVIGVVVPAFNEERFISSTLTTMPDFVDRIYLIDDASQDTTFQVATEIAKLDERITVVKQNQNGGVGSAVVAGYKLALCGGMDIIARMDGDNQMPPSFLSRLLDPITENAVDFSKGNRLSSSIDRQEMPRFRFVGNIILTFLTRMSSGYWKINDPQNGYTAISKAMLQRMDLDHLRKDFAFENDFLINLNIQSARIIDVPHPAVYRGQYSKIKYHSFIFVGSWALLTGWFYRLRKKILR